MHTADINKAGSSPIAFYTLRRHTKWGQKKRKPSKVRQKLAWGSWKYPLHTQKIPKYSLSVFRWNVSWGWNPNMTGSCWGPCCAPAIAAPYSWSLCLEAGPGVLNGTADKARGMGLVWWMELAKRQAKPAVRSLTCLAHLYLQERHTCARPQRSFSLLPHMYNPGSVPVTPLFANRRLRV